MKIYELPAEIQNKVYELQTAAGNTANSMLDIEAKPEEGGFAWHLSPEGYLFWKGIWKGYYKIFYEKYPNVQPYNQVGDKDDFVSHIISHIMKTLPINLGEHSYDEVVMHLEKELNGWNINVLHKNRIEIEDSYKRKIRERYNSLCELVHTTWPGEIYREENGQKIGISVMLNKFICEIGDMMKEAFIAEYLKNAPEGDITSTPWLENILDGAILNVKTGNLNQ